MIKALLRPPVRHARTLGVRIALIRARPGPRRAVFLPAAAHADGAARLRIHEIAPRLSDHGWQVTVLPWRLTLAERHRLIAAAGAEVLMMQSARHALNRPHLYPGIPVVYDLDDADFHLPHLADAVTRDVASATAISAGSRYVADWALGQGAREARVIWTGTPVSSRPRPAWSTRPSVVVWSQTRPQTYTREAEWVRACMAEIGVRRPGVTLRLHDRLPGDDPAFAESFASAGVRVEWQPRRSYKRFLASLDDAALGLAPLAAETPFSRGKSFGKVLAYLDRQVPVIATPTGEHPQFFTPSTGILEADPRAAGARAAALLDDAAARSALAKAGLEAFRSRLTSAAAAARVASLLDQAVALRV